MAEKPANSDPVADSITTSIRGLESELQQCMQRDRFRLRQEFRRLARNRDDKNSDERASRLRERIAESTALRRRRLDSRPSIALDQSLPIFVHAESIAETIRRHQVVVISGETGSGKSTQLPLIAMQAGFGIGGLIGHTQPRRIAARSVANRIASQLSSSLGHHVGFKIRFDDKTSDQTYIKLMTDGILLAESQSDRFFDGYELIIIDEAHERSLNIDFLLGRLKQVLPKRRDLKVVITSATIDTENFAKHFSDSGGNPAPVIHVEGRTYGVEVRYHPPESDSRESDLLDHLVAETTAAHQSESGDILVFLPTENDIRNASRKLKGSIGDRANTDILPLYARLSTAQQNAIFQTSSRRRIVLATNVAESSVTVPGISTVVDSGTARISRYAPRSKVQRLPIEPISQASANQRAGRCGRIGPGVCIRLYSEEDFLSRDRFTTPEIRRTNLASVILQTLSLKLGDIGSFPFIDPPQTEAINDGYRTLFEIGATDDHRKLTRLGRWLARLPVDPRIGRMLFAANEENCLHEVLIIAAALEIQDPRVRPAEKQQAADMQHQKFRHEGSDFMSLLAVWDFFHELRSSLSRRKFRLACQENFLSVSLLQQWSEIHRQLKSAVQQAGLKPRRRRDEFDAIHRSLLTGLLSGIAHLQDRSEYTGAGGTKFHLWPGSSLFEKKPKWIVAAEVVETARRYGRTIARIDPKWIEPIAGHLVKRNHVDPHFSEKRQTVMAYENVTLFGLPIVNRRRVGFARIDPELSRQLFIENGVGEFALQGNFPFLEHNRQILEEVQQLAAKTRRHDLVLDSAVLLQHYGDVMPDRCVDTASLRKAMRDDQTLDSLLRIEMADLLPDEAAIEAESFPDQVQLGTLRIPVEYRFEPGSESDGPTVKVNAEALRQINGNQVGWLIPGLYESRIIALIKSLPKSLRRNFVPVPDSAKQVAARIDPGDGTFQQAVARALTAIAGQPITPDDFNNAKVDERLWLNIQVINEAGEVIDQSRDATQLRMELSDGQPAFATATDGEWNRDRLSDWDWDELPEHVAVDGPVAGLRAFPAIVDQGDAIGLRLAESKSLAKQITRGGLIRLLAIRCRKSLKQQVNWLPGLDQSLLLLAAVAPAEKLKSGLADLIAAVALVDGMPIPRSKEEFEVAVSSAFEPISIATQKVAKWLPRFAQAAHQARLAIESLGKSRQATIDDIEQQIAELTPAGFLSSTRWQWLEQYPRYFSAIEIRCGKATASIESDKQLANEIGKYVQQHDQLRQRSEALGQFDPELQQFRWMIEEYRVSQFAQQLGTMIKVSATRLGKQVGKVNSS